MCRRCVHELDFEKIVDWDKDNKMFISLQSKDVQQKLVFGRPAIEIVPHDEEEDEELEVAKYYADRKRRTQDEYFAARKNTIKCIMNVCKSKKPLKNRK